MKSKLDLNRLICLAALAVFVVAPAASARDAKEQPYPESLQKWVDGGKYMKVRGLDVFVHSSGKAPVKGEGVLVVHGYPGSSWDFSNVVAKVEKKTKIVVPRHDRLRPERHAAERHVQG